MIGLIRKMGMVALSSVLGTEMLAGAEWLVADFEGDGYGGWKSEGEAFGGQPAGGTLAGQMEVSGYRGRGLVNSYRGGDEAIGRLLSPPIELSEPFLNFLIGGGGYAGSTCMNLLLDGKVVRTATGPNTAPGGSERLGPATWDVADLVGKTVRLEIVDARTEGWGHINVDHIVQSDRPAVLEVRRQFEVTGRYLLWPENRDGETRTFLLNRAGEEEPFALGRIRLSRNPDFWMFTDLGHHLGETVTVSATIPGELEEAWKQVRISDTFPGEDEVYREPLRPQYHFTSRRGWLNDPNGLVWNDGSWHLFYQHSPYSYGSQLKSWGHAVSGDLLHWKELPAALSPDEEGSMWSGSGVLAPKDRLGVPIRGEEALVLVYTAQGFESHVPGRKAVQSIAISEDGGKRFRKFEGNPVLDHLVGINRDPKVFWHEPTKHWIMALFLDGDEYGIFRSPDLVRWERTGGFRIPGDAECPDLFELPVEGEPGQSRWVAWGAKGRYLIGGFDGRRFTPEGGVQEHYFGPAYAGQSYDHAPDGRRVHIGWFADWNNRAFQGAAFNQQMTLPMDFTLRRGPEGLRLWIEPSPEIAGLREETKSWTDFEFAPGDADPLAGFEGGAFEVEAVIDAGSDAAEMGFRIFADHPAVWRKADQTFSGMDGEVVPVERKMKLRIFVDTVSMEVFVNGCYGGTYLRQTPGLAPLRIVAKDGAVRFDSLEVHRLKSVWE